ncbi:MAG: hypothetical protein IPN56_13290 [Chitinophagaceae bacterium]|nr:hypothetical protein [Chitinophagaceae bacterium]
MYSKFVSDRDAKEIKTSVLELNQKLESDIYEFESNSCFKVVSINVNNLNLELKEIDAIHSSSLIEKEQRQKDDELNDIKFKLSQSQNKLEQTQAEFELKLQSEKEKHLLQLEKERQMNNILLEKERKKAQLEIQEKELELEDKRNQVEYIRKQQIVELLKTEEGKIAENPEMWYSLQKLVENTKALSLKEQQSFAQDFIKSLFNTKQSYQQGQINTFKKVVEKVFNIQIPDYDDTSSNPIADTIKNFTDTILKPSSDETKA